MRSGGLFSQIKCYHLRKGPLSQCFCFILYCLAPSLFSIKMPMPSALGQPPNCSVCLDEAAAQHQQKCRCNNGIIRAVPRDFIVWRLHVSSVREQWKGTTGTLPERRTV
uniref:Uncharacterized protein n=1 Tax=Globodera rostochiensis TaxID=31243 RepID=A0A914HED5_GLORO